MRDRVFEEHEEQLIDIHEVKVIYFCVCNNNVCCCNEEIAINSSFLVQGVGIFTEEVIWYASWHW